MLIDRKMLTNKKYLFLLPKNSKVYSIFVIFSASKSKFGETWLWTWRNIQNSVLKKIFLRCVLPKQIRFKVRFVCKFPRWTSGKHDWYCHLAAKTHRLASSWKVTCSLEGREQQVILLTASLPWRVLLSGHKLCGWWMDEITIKEMKISTHTARVVHQKFSIQYFLLCFCFFMRKRDEK